jgi:CHAT domain-containing protein
MTRRLLGLVLGMILTGAWCATAADEWPKELTPARHKELGAKWAEEVRLYATCFREGKWPQAVDAGQKQLTTARLLFRKQDHPMLASSIFALTLVLQQQGKYGEAETLHREALAMRRRLYPPPGHPDLALSLDNLAIVLERQGKYAEAEELVREALTIVRRLYPKQDHARLANAVNNLALMLCRLGKLADAEPLCREALALQRRLYPDQNHADLAQSLTVLATVLDRQGKNADAEACFREALVLQRRLYSGQDHPDLAANLNNLGVVLKHQGNHTEAEKLQREAVAIWRRRHAKQDAPDLAWGLNNLANSLQAQGQYAEAETLLREALALRRRLTPQPNHPELAASLHNLATALMVQGKYQDANTHFGEALVMYRALARDYASVRSEGDALTLATTYPSTRECFLTNAWLARAAASTVYAEVWASKAALSRVYEQRALAARAAATDPRAAALLAQLTDHRRGRAALLLAAAPSDRAAAEERDRALVQYARDIETLDRTLRPLLPSLERADKLECAGPSDLQKMLAADVAVVDFLRYVRYEYDLKKPGLEGRKATPRYLAFVITRDQVSWLDLAEEASIERAVRAWREAITSGRAIPPELPAQVRQLVWAKVRLQLPASIKQVYLCPDLASCRVPWAALPGDRPGTLLLEEYAIATVPHAVFLLDKLRPPDALPQRPSAVLAVGGVAYDAALPRPEPVAVYRGAPLLKPGQTVGWTSLPGTAAEVHGVASAAHKKDLVCRILAKDEATSGAVLAALPQARWAHLATHGFFADASFRSALQIDPRLFEMTLRGERIGAGALSPMVMTGLVFAGANKPDTPGRGIVTGEALVDLDLSGLELAVLSACETGLGDVAGGEGTFGLQRAFHLAGTRDVIASLWKVPDRPTAALMALFYQNLWEKDLPPIEALRQAQLAIYREPAKITELAATFRGKFVEIGNAAAEVPPTSPDGKAHPRLWAAFTLSGPGTAVSIAPRGRK